MILALDQAYTATGWAIIDDSPPITPITWGVIKPPAKGPRAAKRRYIIDQIADLSVQPDLIVIEELWERPGISLSTALIDYAYSNRIEIKALNVLSWKKAVLGNAKATKADSLAFVSTIDQKINDHNIADAICIGICASTSPKLLKQAE
ncbi:Holliday junction resolvasome RuvABC endonuclease subunit [Thermosporothrix hazakensis]|uniref:Holliday junction resolvasome RuvABC endonuclease subunit n=1 Tax=Thermosporothrix hazakensis TaxID=644383 RepID=A0A326U6A7_THEHA|nr:crossover junction endodeoxyribonuclease RuvC [Thermosporothrix hazakensis]PZW19668.1 Holliday junction resolvasome RuvABC endonuclease subunit [Thermosporothrix hazakensis]GCE49220.1 hypothetical protein KTH_40890 [Thermosporothrix hazakensis]